MIIVFGLVLLVVAAVVAVAGILGNTGSGHALTNAFTVFGHHMTGSTGALFLYGVVIGAVGMLGLALLLTGARRGATARRGLRRSRRETAAVSKRRDELVQQRDTARAEATTVAKDRDSLAEERDTLAGQRDDLISRPGGTREQTAGTRLAPMVQDDGEPAPDNGHRGPHLLLGRGLRPSVDRRVRSAGRNHEGNQS